jgi:polysaccharide deacetylase family protein (PEP-CTERM system associated)
MQNILSVDVEEYFHPSELARTVRPLDWSVFPSRVDRQVSEILEIFARHQVKATFFVLGWIAEHHPAVVRSIHGAGHEIGCHSYAHQLVYDLTPAEFAADTKKAVRAIEDACGVTPLLYRAPSYSITAQSLWALDILAENGFTHDSSIYPISHDRYGIPGFGRQGQVVHTTSGPIFEVPIATVKFSAKRMSPVGGGGYLRLLPYCYTAAGIRRINEMDQMPACIYFHPWEIDPKQPRLTSSRISRLRTYGGLNGMKSKVERLLRDFRFAPMTTVYPGVASPQTAITGHRF